MLCLTVAIDINCINCFKGLVFIVFAEQVKWSDWRNNYWRRALRSTLTLLSLASLSTHTKQTVALHKHDKINLT